MKTIVALIILLAVAICFAWRDENKRIADKNLEIQHITDQRNNIAAALQDEIHRSKTLLEEKDQELKDWKSYAGQLSDWGNRAISKLIASDREYWVTPLQGAKPGQPQPKPPIVTVTNVVIFYYQHE
jgi:uncharacterized small protein (DUF1192 family)